MANRTKSILIKVIVTIIFIGILTFPVLFGYFTQKTGLETIKMTSADALKKFWES